MKNMIVPFIGTLVIACGSLQAQTPETARFSFDLGAGFTTPLGRTASFTDSGWDIRGGAGINLGSHFSVMANVSYDSLGINSATLGSIGVPGGNTNIFSARLDPVYHIGTYRKVDFYVTAGGGVYHYNTLFNNPSSGVTASLPYNSFFGTSPITYTNGLVSNAYSINKPGVDGGVGLSFGSKWHGKFFAEARYNRIFTTADRHFDYLPVSFGFRW